MKINYSKRYVNGYLIAGILYLALAVFLGYYRAHPLNYIWFLFAAVYLAIHFYQKKEKYLTIENGVLKVNLPYGEKIRLSEVKQIKVFGGKYILKTNESKLKINTQIISPNSMEDLKNELDKLNLS
ncbi:hypothetical protein AB8P51_15055 [Muriicola sp. SD30]|uniref:hypothetical protein n=1 Tax=Muriicola sp. SD30 TaxID=3240936 RepID=UPI00350FDBB9